MNPKLSQPWLPIEKIENYVQLEPALVTLGLALAAFLFYKIALRRLSPERHKFLHSLFLNVSFHIALVTGLFLTYGVLRYFSQSFDALERICSYVGLITLLSGATLFVKTARVLALEYLFFRHQKTGVPMLLINFFTLFLWMLLAGWIVTDVFSLRVAPLLATSAVFSLVLGLALQDTLGNLLAGITLQLDKPYSIGDWIEVTNNGQKWVGQIYEISWRATVLVAFSEEMLTIPNRIMAQAEISNFAAKIRPFCRGQTFRIPYGAPVDRAKSLLLEAAQNEPSVCKTPGPMVFITEAADSWITLRLIYYVDNYPTYLSVGDRVIDAALQKFAQEGIALAPPRIVIEDRRAAV